MWKSKTKKHLIVSSYSIEENSFYYWFYVLKIRVHTGVDVKCNDTTYAYWHNLQYTLHNQLIPLHDSAQS